MEPGNITRFGVWSPERSPLPAEGDESLAVPEEPLFCNVFEGCLGIFLAPFLPLFLSALAIPRHSAFDELSPFH